MKVTFYILVLLGLAACGPTSNEPQVTAPVATQAAATPPMIATRLLAETAGELTIEDECLRIDGYLLVWPPEFTVDIREDRVEIVDELTGEKVVWRGGETVQVGGGEVSYAALDDQVRQRIEPCSKGGAGAFWLVGDIAIPATPP